MIRPAYYFHNFASPILDVPESQSQPTQPVADQEPEAEARRNAADARADSVLLPRVQRARGCRHSGTDERARGDVLKEQGDELMAVFLPPSLLTQMCKIDNVQVSFVPPLGVLCPSKRGENKLKSLPTTRHSRV